MSDFIDVNAIIISDLFIVTIPTLKREKQIAGVTKQERINKNKLTAYNKTLLSLSSFG